MSIIQKADVKLFLNIPTATTPDDTLLDKLIACAEADAEVQVGGQISTISTFVELFDGDGESGQVLLNNGPVTSVDAVYDDVTRVYGAETLVSAGIYNVTAAGVLKLDPGFFFTRGVQNVKVEYHAGYSAVPEDYKKALVYMVMADYMGVKTRINAVADDEIGGKIKALRAQAKEILDRYKVYGSGN